MSTPIIDWHQTLVDAMPALLRNAPRPLFNSVMKLGNLFSRTQLIAYEKFFEWQVGAQDFAEAMEKFRPWKVDVGSISSPVLCMLGTGELLSLRLLWLPHGDCHGYSRDKGQCSH